MIVAHKILNPNISNKSIETVAEREGYTLFLPFTFVRHLAAAYSFYVMGRYPHECIEETNEYTKSFSKLLNMIEFAEVKTSNAIVFAIKVLQLVSKKIDLRQIETAATTGITFAVEPTEKFTNYKFDLQKLSEIQLATLGLSNEDPTTVILCEEIQKILLFYEGMNVLERTVDPEYDTIKKQITSYNDYYKGRKYKIVLPTFGIDLATKKLQITKVEDKEVFTSEVILIIDCSLSMASSKLSETMIRSVLLYYINQMELHSNLSILLAYAVGEISSVRRITKVEELQDIFHRLPAFTLPVKRSTYLFHDLESLYPGRSVIFLSDGRLEMDECIKLNYKLYIIALKMNPTLKKTCLLSGGQYIVLE